MKSFRAIGGLVMLLAGCGAATETPPGATGKAAAAACGRASWVAGTTEFSRGRMIYRDYVYDDYGADTGAVGPTRYPAGALAASAGDQVYPAGAENTADLVRLELWREGEQLQLAAELNALYAGDETIVVVAIDTDADATTGGGPWPGLAVATAGWDVMHRFSGGDPASNVIRGALPLPASPRWRIWAVTAQRDGTIMNVAFRGPDERSTFLGAAGAPSDAGAWWEDGQAAALAAGDITTYAQELRADDLRADHTRAADAGPGLHQRVFTSAYTLPPGEGVSYAGVPSRINPSNSSGSQQFNFLGRYQPYAFYQPSGPGPHGVQLMLHGLGTTHASIVNQPGFQAEFGERANRVLVSPLGRGVVGFYSDVSERDVLEALDDVLAHFDVDPDAVVIGGYSMGGYGALRLAMLYPERFAALVNWVGPTGDDTNAPLPGNPTALDLFNAAEAGSFAGNMIDFAGNLRNMPSVHLYAGGDALAGANNSLALQERLAAADGVVHDFYLHPDAEHLTFALLDQWGKEGDFLRDARRTEPARVTYRLDESLAYPEYGIRHDAAWWVSAIRAAAPGYADVDLASRGCARPEPRFETGTDAGTGPAPLFWVRGFRRLAAQYDGVADNALEGSLSNVASLRVDTRRACLRPGAAWRIVTNVPATITFSPGGTRALAPGVNIGRL